MSELITWEWRFLAVSIMWGMILAAVYDVLRIIRRVFIHRKVWTLAAEDILFWMMSGFAMFHIIFMVNDGIIRSFAIIGFIIGAAMYQYAVSHYIVKYMSKLLIELKKIIKKVFGIIIKPLKKQWKYITIKLKKLRQARLEAKKEKKRLRQEQLEAEREKLRQAQLEAERERLRQERLEARKKRLQQEQSAAEKEKAGKKQDEKVRNQKKQRASKKKKKTL